MSPFKCQTLTIILTESCNLDCWMCDFGRKDSNAKLFSLEPFALVNLLKHSVFAKSLRVINLTGGEPFLHPLIAEYCEKIQEADLNFKLIFSSNGTLLKPMQTVFRRLKNTKNRAPADLLISIDGITKHDQQRKTDGALKKTLHNILTLKAEFPTLAIRTKFTITPVNFNEIFTSFQALTEMQLPISFKLIEYNPFYNNKNRSIQETFVLNLDQLSLVAEQLSEVLRQPAARHFTEPEKIRELIASLATPWQRKMRCATPKKSILLATNLDVFTCKEFAPVTNLRSGSLDDLAQSPKAAAIAASEAKNEDHCNRCTSEMRMPKSSWRNLFA